MSLQQAVKGSVILVTGASSGIGKEFAQLAATHGAKLALVARRKAELEEVASCCNGALPIVADVSKRAEVERAVATTLEHYGSLDVLVNNVGRGITRRATELTDEDIDEMMRANVFTALYGMQSVLPHFQSVGRGHIINVSSKLGRNPSVLPRSAYNASKHFLNALTANFREEIAQTHPEIAVSLVSPGLVYTDFGAHARHSTGDESRQHPNGQEADEVASVILQVVETRQPDVYTKTGYKAQVMEYLDRLTADP